SYRPVAPPTFPDGRRAGGVVEHATHTSRSWQRGSQRMSTDAAQDTSFLWSGPLRGSRRRREKAEQYRPEQGDPSEENEPARIGMRDQHVLKVGRGVVGVVADQDDDYHSEDIRDIRGHHPESEEKPHTPGRALELGQHEGYEGGRKDAKGVDPGARRRNDDGYLNSHM